MVRAKFQVTAITEHVWGNGVKTVRFEPRYDASIPEDQRFAEATPSGELSITVNNPAALEQFKLGQQFYLDFTPVEG